MTDRERAIVMAYTGVAMLTGDSGGFGCVGEEICTVAVKTAGNG